MMPPPPLGDICCLQSFPLEDIIRKVRKNDHIVFNSTHIMLYQNPSQITLKNHRALHPSWKNVGRRYNIHVALSLSSYNGR